MRGSEKYLEVPSSVTKTGPRLGRVFAPGWRSNRRSSRGTCFLARLYLRPIRSLIAVRFRCPRAPTMSAALDKKKDKRAPGE